MMLTKRLSNSSSRHRANLQIVCEAIVVIATVSVVIGLAGWAFWTFDRGFEVTDESYYILNGRFPEAIRFFFSPTQWIASPLWWLGGSLAGFRAAGFVVLTLCAGALGYGLAKVGHWFGVADTDRPVGRVLMIGASIIGSWLYGAIISFSPSYNSLSTAGAYLAVGLFLAGLDCTDTRRSLANAIAVGVALALTLIAKFTSGISVVGLVLGMYAVFWRAPGVRWINVAATCLAVPIALVGIASFYDAPTHAWAAFREGLALTDLAQQNESMMVRLLRNWNECLALLVSSCEMFGVPLACAVLAALFRRSLFGIAGAIVVAVIVARAEFPLGSTDKYLTPTMPLIAIVILSMVTTLLTWCQSLRLTMLVGGLFLLPFLIALGSGNPLSSQINLSLASWGLLCATLAMAAKGGERLVTMLLCLILMATIAGHIIMSGIRAPYRLSGPITEQTIPVDIQGLGRVRVDSATKQFIDDVRAAANHCRISREQPYLGFYNLPGVALVLDAVPVDVPWLFADTFARAVVQRAKATKIRSAIIAVKLAENGNRTSVPGIIGFPANYRLCGTATLPFQKDRFELWVPTSH
jgi:hypothetical protein